MTKGRLRRPLVSRSTCALAFAVLGIVAASCAGTESLPEAAGQQQSDAVAATAVPAAASDPEAPTPATTPSEVPKSAATAATVAGAKPAGENDCKLTAEVTARHRVEVPALTELSGLGATGHADVTLWGHNDHGNSAEIVAMDTKGHALAWWPVAAPNIDWEDIAIRRFGETEQVVIADIGDNDDDRASISLLYVDTPTNPAARGVLQPEIVELRYPDGPRNAEALLVHPITGEAIVVSKTNGSARVYTTHNDPLTVEAPALGYVVSIELDGKVLAGDMSPEAHLVALRTARSVYVWVSHPDGLKATFESAPCRFGLDQHKPEALAFLSSSELLSSGEGSSPDLITLTLAPQTN